MADPDIDDTLITHPPRQTLPHAAGDREGTLTVLLGADVGAVFGLPDEQMVIGRGDGADLALDDDGISRRQARVVRIGMRYELEDLGSTNGTFVNGKRIAERVPIQDGDRVQVGNTLLRFELQDPIDRQASRRIYEMTVRDALTGVYNRRYLDEQLAREFAFAARHSSPLCVLLCDIDHFKRVNDRFGHGAGDHVLQRLAGELQASVRIEDVLARYGGEEFAIVARGIDVAGARVFAERMRSIIERMQVQWDGQPIPTTLSIGVAHNHAGAAVMQGGLLLAAADTALYAAKRAGRNRTELAVSPGAYRELGEAARPRVRKSTWSQDTAPAPLERTSGEVVRSATKSQPR